MEGRFPKEKSETKEKVDSGRRGRVEGVMGEDDRLWAMEAPAL
jgi:hypothetical protein